MRNMLLAAALVALVSPHGFADPSATPDVQRMAGDDCARARKAGKTCVLDMGSETIDGNVKTEDGISLSLIRFGSAASLIRLRWEFIPEILRTAEDLD